MNTFEYQLRNGSVRGIFNVYQAKSGAIMMVMGNRFTPLTRDQLNDLQLDLYSLIGFNHDDFIAHYHCHAERV